MEVVKVKELLPKRCDGYLGSEGLLVYKWKLIVPESWYEPKIGNIKQFLKSHDYPIETHQVKTNDGYILTMHRIPNKKSNKPPVFLMHGLLLSSIDWVVMGPGKSIGLILADAGYDVWLGNNRGNTHSRNHEYLDGTLQKEQFFNYSYHEIGLYDLPAMIDYVIDQTGYPKINYIGFSEGVTSFLVMGSLKPEYNEKILLMNAYAPVTDAHNITNVFFNLLAISPKILGLAELIGWHEMFDLSTSPLFRLVCQIKPLCDVFFNLIGISQNQLVDQELQLALLSNFPAGMSLKQIRHYVQGTRTGNFTFFNSKDVYDLTKVTAPMIIYYGEADNLINNEVLLNLVAKQLPNLVQILKVPYEEFNHMDFLWGKDTYLLAKKTLKNIDSFNSN
ncbi:unnamed protein product [Ceutorhynchus assimilis]|uniref:Lipase n=1 Tax=Ceutorhynchus assimilis TaxID=467358 RepID=A0A9N9MPM8_9CUCU|nr:unnamed protein product [Ceutorhynchus assimilis]